MKSHENLSVTAIIPTFRSENVVRRAINSVLNQSFPPLAIIVVDDASDDQTVEVVRELAQVNDQIQLIVNPKNIGPGQARNVAWSMATTDYIAFLDADDTWHPKKIEMQLEWFSKNHPEVICGTQHRIIDQPDSSSDGISISKFTLNDLLRRNRFTTPSVMLRRDIALRFDPGLRLSEDYLLWMEIADQYGHVSRIDQPLTILHKPEFGAQGLSGKIFAMYFGETTALRILAKKNRIGQVTFFRSYVWSTLKLGRRLPLAMFRKIAWRKGL